MIDYSPVPGAQPRIESLRGKTNNGQLTDSEHAEYERLIEKSEIISKTTVGRATVKLLQINAPQRRQLRDTIGL